MWTSNAWSETEFEDGALKLVQVLLQMESQLSFDSPWSFRNGCLEAAVVTVSCESDPADTSRRKIDMENPALVDDETCIWKDSDVVVPTVGAPESSLQRRRWLRWTLSGVYSHVWHVPVLYFTVQRGNGTHMTRPELLTELKFYQNNATAVSGAAVNSTTPSLLSDLSWEFCSYELHPVTGMPSFMVHPCQTKECLQVLQTTRRCNLSNVALDVWSWLSWILPSIGVSVISPHTFQRVCRRILESSVVDKNANS
jgi:Autophagocytosis associated protein, active-site domain